MYRELAFAFHHIKGVAEIFHSTHIRHYGLFLVDFEIYSVLYKSGYALLYSHCCPFGLAEFVLVGQEPWEQLHTRHLVDTSTALVSHYCLVGTVEICRTKDLLKKVFLVEWYLHDVVFTYPHEGLHSPIPFGFRPISLGAAINLG